MAARPPVQGYNHDFRHQGLVYHVQTEDYGVERRKVVSQLFYEGAILAVVSADYAPDADDEAAVRKQMQAQHKALMRQLLRGKLDVHPSLPEPPAPPAAEPPPAPAAAEPPAPPPVAPPPGARAQRAEPLRPTIPPEPVRENDPIDPFLFSDGPVPLTVSPDLTAEDWQLLDALIDDFSDGKTPVAGIELRRRVKRPKTVEWTTLDSDLDDL